LPLAVVDFVNVSLNGFGQRLYRGANGLQAVQQLLCSWFTSLEKSP